MLSRPKGGWSVLHPLADDAVSIQERAKPTSMHSCTRLPVDGAVAIQGRMMTCHPFVDDAAFNPKADGALLIL